MEGKRVTILNGLLNAPDTCAYYPLEHIWSGGIHPLEDWETIPQVLICYVVCAAVILIFGILRPSCKLTPEQRQELWMFKFHNNFNLAIMPVIIISIALSTTGLLPNWVVSTMMFSYMILDGVWTIVWPEIVPSNEKIVINHHMVTIALVTAPLTWPGMSWFTDWFSLVEINTFLYFVSKLKPVKKNVLLNALVQIPFWITVVLCRGIIQPLAFFYIWTFECTDVGFTTTTRLVSIITGFYLLCFNVWWMYKRVIGTYLKKTPTNVKKAN